VTWRTKNAWPCSLVEGDLLEGGVLYSITRQPMAGPKWAIGLPDKLAARLLLGHGVEKVATVKQDGAAKKPLLQAGSAEAASLEETATDFVVQLVKGKDGKVTETKETKPVTPIAIVPTEPTEAGVKGK
jgi:hypothetical protein